MGSPRRFLATHRGVGSPALKLHYDVTNFLDYSTIYNNAVALTEQFDLLHDYIMCADCKDIRVEDEKQVFLSSKYYAGDGLINWPAYVTLMGSLPARTPLFIEHVPEADVPQVKRFLDGIVREAGLAWTQ
jgi:sugar phosphate isomerase/epimerase